MIKRYAYKNTTSMAGYPVEFEINISEIFSIKCWFNFYGNPSYVYHMDNGDTYYLVDEFGGMNNINNLRRDCVNRRKDMFNKFIRLS